MVDDDDDGCVLHREVMARRAPTKRYTSSSEAAKGCDGGE